MRKNEQPQGGFTLIEVLIAMLILAIVILGAAAMQITSINGNSRAMRLTEATNLGENRLETIMSEPYDDLIDSNADGFAGLGNATAASADGTDQNNGMDIYWNVADNYPVFGTKTIRVLVQRTDNDRQLKTITQDFIRIGPI